MTQQQSEARDERVKLSEEEIERLSADSEGGAAVRATGFTGWVTSGAALGLAAYALYWTQFSVNTVVYRTSFLGVALALCLLLFPLARAQDKHHIRLEDVICGLLAAGLCVFLAVTVRLTESDPRSFAVLLAGAAAFAALPLATYAGWIRRSQLVDWCLALLSLLTALYVAANFEAFKDRTVSPIPAELVLGGLLVLIILEAARRATGWVLPAITLLFLVFSFVGNGGPIPDLFEHRGFSINRIIGQNYLTLEGIFSTPVDVAATFIILFTIYGAVLERSGAGKFFLDWTFALFGKKPSPSAPGRAIMSSGFLLGTVSGSGVATTVTLSSIGWPMLRRAGYTPEVAGGMLSAAGIGAVLSPPTLGAAAFMIAEYLNIDYVQVLMFALMPTLLYYLCCWLMTEADTRRLQVKAIKTSDASVWQLTKRDGYHFISLGAIAVLLAAGFTSFMAVFWSIVVSFCLSMIRVENRLVTLPAFFVGLGVSALVATYGLLAGQGAIEQFELRASVIAFWGVAAAAAFDGIQLLLNPAGGGGRMVRTLIEGSRATIGIAATCACAGLIVSAVNLTGLGLTLSALLVNLGGGERLLVILLAAVAMWVLGLAVPVTASYLIAAVMLVPALVQIGIPAPAAHMFIFYYACLADVSPPTALAPFAAAAITGARPFSTVMQAWKYTLPAFLVPVIFCLSADGLYLLFIVPDAAAKLGYALPSTLADYGHILAVTISVCIGLIAFCIALTGEAICRAGPVERVVALLAGVALVPVSLAPNLVGYALLGGLLAYQLLVRRRERDYARRVVETA